MRDVVFFVCAVFSSPSLTELEINFQPLLFQLFQLIPFCLHCCDGCMSLYRSTQESAVFLSRAEFTLSSLASLWVMLCCHFSLLWERYVHLFGRFFFKHRHFECSVVSLIKVFK